MCRCGPRLAAVLRGHEDPLELLFPGGSMNEAEAVYADSPAAQFYNKLAGAAIEALVEDAVSEQTGLRLLEIGGGTGGTTTSILPLLPSPYSEYWFTDLSDAFLKRARQRWQGPFPFVRYGIFNAELDPVHQGYPARSFDAALAVNVLHATRDLKVTLTNTHRLLRPSGLLVLSEVTETKHTAVADCTWGLTEGWWLFSDGREFAPQSRDQWQQWLNLTGFALASDAMQPRLSECGALEAQTVFAARASVTNPASVATPQASVGSFVVTGGLGGIGLVTGCWLVECHSVSQLMLTSRSGAVKDETDQSTLKRLQHDPCTRVLAVGCDITQLNQVQRLVLECPWLCGLVHSVGVLSDAVIENQQLAAFQKVTSPKADGACHLLKLTQSAPLDCYAVYSSIAGVFGSPGQSPHASANAALDSLVQRLQVCGQAAVGLQWGAWSQIGYAARVGADARANKANAMPSFGPGVGLRALASAWFSLCTVTVTPITSLHKFEFTRSVQHMLKNLPDAGTKARLAGQIDSVDCEIIDGLMGHKSDDQQRAALEEMVARKVHEAAGMKVEATDPLMDSGVDSLAAIELKAGLESELGGVTRLPSTMMFDYPTVRAIAENLHSKLKGWPAALPCASVLAAAQYETQELILAAMACYAPGSCASTTSFAWLLASGNDCLESIPLQRFDADALDGTVLALSAKQGHFLAHPERFDNGHFRISPAEAAAIDPHQRLLLEVGYCAFASRGESRSSLMGSATAVLVGVMTDGEWATCQQRMTMDRPQPMSAFAANGSGPAALAGRLSFVLGLKGPCFSVTTVCSSSLVALDAAAQNLQLGRCTAALVSGVNMIFDPVGFVALGPALAPDGKCKTFDAAANGLGRGDACGSVLLRGAALKKDTVVLKSSGVNNDGRSASMAAPNGPSQVELLQSVNQRASAVGVRRGCLETHGTGTALGDPIEVGALRTVFEHETSQSEPMMLGALKSRLGHTEGAAGVMGVVKAVIMLQHAVSAPNLHFLSANPKVELDGFGIVLPIGDTACNGQASGAEERFSRGVSSFGMSGTNSHAVLVTLNAVAVKPGARLPGVSSAVMYKQSPFAWWAVGDLDASQLDSQWLSNH